MGLTIGEQFALEKRYALTNVVPLELAGWSTYWFGRLGLKDTPTPIKIQAKGPTEAWETLAELDSFNTRNPEDYVMVRRSDLDVLLDMYVDHGPGADGDEDMVERVRASLRVKAKDNEMRRLRFLFNSLKPEEIGNDSVCQSRIRELLGWFDRFADGHANDKWFRRHCYELLHFIASGRSLE